MDTKYYICLIWGEQLAAPAVRVSPSSAALLWDLSSDPQIAHPKVTLLAPRLPTTNDIQSSPVEVKYGVPQGSVLGSQTVHHIYLTNCWHRQSLWLEHTFVRRWHSNLHCFWDIFGHWWAGRYRKKPSMYFKNQIVDTAQSTSTEWWQNIIFTHFYSAFAKALGLQMFQLA